MTGRGSSREPPAEAGDEQKTLVVGGKSGGGEGRMESVSMDPREFELARRAAIRAAAAQRPSALSINSRGPTQEELALFNRLKQETSPIYKDRDALEAGKERSILHAREHAEYMDLPKGCPDRYRYPPETASDYDCSLPKLLLHSYQAHHRGVTAVKFMPLPGHLLLSAGLDCRAKLWSVLEDGPGRRQLRTFIGHSRPIRDIQFERESPDGGGKRFVTLAGDRFLKLWSTETGQCLLALEHKKQPTCASYVIGRHATVLLGSTDGKIGLWDLRAPRLIADFSGHATGNQVLTVTPVAKDRFVSTSEDRTVKLWDMRETSLPVYTASKPEVCDAYPAALLHPTQPVISMSSLRSEIHSFNVLSAAADAPLDRLSLRPRSIVGHHCNGSISRLAFSPDGKYIAAGDGRGQLKFWDWVSGQPARTLDHHSQDGKTQQITDIAWSPVESSLVASSSLDGTIKLWA